MQFLRRPAQRPEAGDGLDVLQLFDPHGNGTALLRPGPGADREAPSERETLSVVRERRLDPGCPSWLALSKTETRVVPDMPARPSRERVIDMRRLTKRRHIDLARVSSAFCCR
ncbi:putative leader peptide [Streptomyces sp. NBC_00138]|uniref:putative leader peptide n=1 Tax=Streptomyces sp. NBC_00138 TaxID=2903625 RepID=UPI00386EF5AD